MHHYISETYIEVNRKFMAACAWLDSLGIEYSRTRVGNYGKIFDALAKCQQAGTLETFCNEYSFESFVNAAHEAAEIVRIYEGLGEHSVPSLTIRLKNALKGQELYVLDSENRSGRDFSFELSTAAKFVGAGLTVDFGHDADLKVQIDSFTLFVECKRLKSTKKIQKRIKEGLSQLHKRYVESEQPSNARGLLAISIGKTINARLGLLEGLDYIDLGNKAFSHNRTFVEKYKSYWQDKSDRRTLGVAISLDSPGIIKPEKQLVTCHEVTINNIAHADTQEYKLLYKITHNVFKNRI